MINRFLTVAFVAIALSACSQVEKEYESPVGYDFNKPELIKMPSNLVEISGHTFANSDKETIYAIQDEDAIVYSLKPDGSVTSETKFGKHGDFEDVAIMNNYVIILRSDGTLFNFPFSEMGVAHTSLVKELPNLVPKGEYEGMFARSDSKEIYILCKKCEADKNQEQLSGYVLQMSDSGGLTAKSTFTIITASIFEKLGSKKTKFNPSALAFNSQSKEWYVVSSVNKALVILDESWNVKNVYKLNSSLFNQPEGIAFDADNNLYISNEGGKHGDGTILKFPLQQRVKQ